jgi:hypothetical protein
MSLNDFPKDLINLLITEYIDPFTSLKCLTVSKKFHNSVDPTFVRHRAVKYNVWKDTHAATDNLILCSLCNCLLNKKNLEKHLEKHDQNPAMQYHHSYLAECDKCGLKFPNKRTHLNCPLELTSCFENTRVGYNFIHLCEFRQMPRPRLWIHTCKLQCFRCEEIIEIGYPFIRTAIYEHNRDKHSQPTGSVTKFLFFGIITLALGYHWWG